jgi:hypothetical protein
VTERIRDRLQGRTGNGVAAAQERSDNEIMKRPTDNIKRLLVEISAVVVGFLVFLISTAIFTSYLFLAARRGWLTLPSETDFLYSLWLLICVAAVLTLAFVFWRHHKSSSPRSNR